MGLLLGLGGMLGLGWFECGDELKWVHRIGRHVV